MTTHYTATAKLLHWLMAALLFGMLALGFYMHDLPLSPTKLQIYSWHKWAGVTAFLLLAFRLLWRVTHRPPALPESMPKLMQFAAEAVNWTRSLISSVVMPGFTSSPPMPVT